MRAWLGAVVSMAVPLAAWAQDPVVGNVGLRSSDVPTASLAPLEAALDRALSMQAPVVRGKTATLGALAADPEVSARRAEARRAADAGANAMRQLDLDKAIEEFDRSVALFLAAHGDRLEPAEVARIYTTRAKVASMQRSNASLTDELERALPLHPTKQLDPNTFPPDTVALFQKLLATAIAKPPSPPATAALLDVARRARMKWVVAGEVRGTAEGYRVLLVLVDAAASQAWSADFVSPSDGSGSAFENAVQKLLRESGAPARGTGILVANPTGGGTSTAGGGTQSSGVGAAPTPTPVPAQALPKRSPPPKGRPPSVPVYRRWYVVAGAAAVVILGVGVAAASRDGDSDRTEQPPPPPDGVTLVIERP